ncbi:hypothetical protein B0H14DRAFT_3631178 [Mycena olivaceomarginata]|nr:hypothetical protein B0H14DRAFT_3631178 [Mycena olivaceomarginata]
MQNDSRRIRTQVVEGEWTGREGREREGVYSKYTHRNTKILPVPSFLLTCIIVTRGNRWRERELGQRLGGGEDRRLRGGGMRRLGAFGGCRGRRAREPAEGVNLCGANGLMGPARAAGGDFRRGTDTGAAGGCWGGSDVGVKGAAGLGRAAHGEMAQQRRGDSKGRAHSREGRDRRGAADAGGGASAGEAGTGIGTRGGRVGGGRATSELGARAPVLCPGSYLKSFFSNRKVEEFGGDPSGSLPCAPTIRGKVTLPPVHPLSQNTRLRSPLPGQSYPFLLRLWQTLHSFFFHNLLDAGGTGSAGMIVNSPATGEAPAPALMSIICRGCWWDSQDEEDVVAGAAGTTAAHRFSAATEADEHLKSGASGILQS